MSSDKTFRFDESVCGRCGRTAPAGCVCVGTKAFRNDELVGYRTRTPHTRDDDKWQSDQPFYGSSYVRNHSQNFFSEGFDIPVAEGDEEYSAGDEPFEDEGTKALKPGDRIFHRVRVTPNITNETHIDDYPALEANASPEELEGTPEEYPEEIYTIVEPHSSGGYVARNVDGREHILHPDRLMPMPPEEKHFKALSALIGYNVKASDHNIGDRIVRISSEEPSTYVPEGGYPEVAPGSEDERLREMVGRNSPVLGDREATVIGKQVDDEGRVSVQRQYDGESQRIAELAGYRSANHFANVRNVIGSPFGLGHEEGRRLEGTPEEFTAPLPGEEGEKAWYRHEKNFSPGDEVEIHWGSSSFPMPNPSRRPESYGVVDSSMTNGDYAVYVPAIDDLMHAYVDEMTEKGKSPGASGKMLSYLNMGSGGALVPPPEFTLKAKKKKKTVQGEGKSEQNLESGDPVLVVPGNRSPRVKMGVMRATAPNRIDLVVEIVAKLFNEQAVQQFLQEMAGGIPPQQGKMFQKNILRKISPADKARAATANAMRAEHGVPLMTNPVDIRLYQDFDSEENPNAPYSVYSADDPYHQQDGNVTTFGDGSTITTRREDKSFGTKIILKRLRVPFVKNLRGHLVKAGFTGTMQDAMGRRMCFSAGKRVHCARDEKGTHDDKVRQEEAPVPGNLSSGEGTANPVVQGIDVLKEIKFRIQGIASQCSLPPNAVRDVVLFLLEIPDEILIAFNAELDIRGEEIRAVLSQVIDSMVPQPEGMVDGGKPVPPSLKMLKKAWDGEAEDDGERHESDYPTRRESSERTPLTPSEVSRLGDAYGVDEYPNETRNVIKNRRTRDLAANPPNIEGQKGFPSPDLVLYEMQKNPNPTELERMQMELLMRILNDR